MLGQALTNLMVHFHLYLTLRATSRMFQPGSVQLTLQKKCVTIHASNGEWEALECKDSGSNQTTLCRVPPLDEFDYNLETGKFIVLITNFALYQSVLIIYGIN